MREILFRGKRIDNGEWVYGYYFCMHHNDSRTHIHHFIIPLNIDISKEKTIAELQVEVDPATVGEFTGLTDKNGKKLFEGDILGYSICAEQRRDVVVYGRWNCSCCDGVYGYALLHYGERVDFREVNRYEICGNIHDNPELLEMGKCAEQR